MDLDVTTTSTTTTTTTTQALATIPLASIAARAGGLASHEEREMTRLVSSAVNVTLEKFELKLKQFNEMESILQAERRELERGRQELLLDRLRFKNRVRTVEDALRTAAESGDLSHLKRVQQLGEGSKLAFVDEKSIEGQQIEQPSLAGGVKSFEI